MTLDSHHKKHIAHASFWSSKPNDREGSAVSPTPFTVIYSQAIAVDKYIHPVTKKEETGWWPRDCSLEVCVCN